MRIDREQALKAFREYVAHYNAEDEKVRLKIEHTYRVADLCGEIAGWLMLPKEDIDLAWLIGILHDIGRFEQLRRYGTFHDAQSIDHAACGAEILFAEGKIRDFVRDDSQDSLLKTAVASHNAYRIPEGLPARTEQFCHIIRDADKIDILYTPSPVTPSIPTSSPESPAAAASSGAIPSHWHRVRTPCSLEAREETICRQQSSAKNRTAVSWESARTPASSCTSRELQGRWPGRRRVILQSRFSLRSGRIRNRKCFFRGARRSI